MSSFFITIDASSIYSVDAPTLELLVDGQVVSSANIHSGYTATSFTLDFTGSFPSSFSLRFQDGSSESGRSVTINSISINGQDVSLTFLSTTTLSHTQESTVNTSSIDHLFALTNPTVADFDTVTHQGTSTSEVLNGTANNDVIIADGDADIAKGGAGNDQISGGDGNDILKGGSGNDLIIGDAGNDLIKGEDGDDYLLGGSGLDNLIGGAGNDVQNGGADNDTLSGGTGDDILYGGSGNDLLKGEADNDILYGGADNDRLIGGDGIDRLYGEDGNDVLEGDAGDDILDGGAGNDRLRGGDGNDTLTGSAGTDKLEGHAGDDILNAGDDNDTALGGAGNDIIDGGAGNDRLYGGDDVDTITGGSGLDRVQGDAGDDILNGGDDNDTVWGGEGNDTAHGDAGNDRVLGHEGNDTVYGDAGNDFVHGNEGNDTVSGGDGNDNVTGDEGDDIVNGNDGFDKVFGGAGNDTVHGDSGNDRVYGNEGSDTVYGDEGNDRLYASAEQIVTTIHYTERDSVYSEDFSGGTNGYTYSDGGFGGSDPGAADNVFGNHYTGMGTGGSVYVYGRGENGSTHTDLSGNWSTNFTLAANETDLNLNFDYRMLHFASNTAGEDVQLFAEINGVQYGLSGNNYITEVLGGPGSNVDTGFVNVSIDIPDLSAGTHTISIGLLKTSADSSSDISYVIFDNVDIGRDIDHTVTHRNVMDDGESNTLYGGDGFDTLYGSAGNDVLYGGADNDALYSGTTVGLQEQIDTILASNADVVYDAAANSFYKFFSGALTYDQANAAAQGETLNGLNGNGYLVTITSQAENDLIEGLTGTNYAWINGSDADTEGSWVYTDGPETGTQYWQGNETGSAVNGAYTNWYTGGAPLDSNGDYDYSLFLGSSFSGQHYAYLGTYQANYVVEWDASSLGSNLATNTLNGGDGFDALYGADGHDIFAFDNLNGVDSVYNFDTSTGDQIDVSDLLNFNLGDDIADYLQLTDSGPDTLLAADIDGAANGSNFVNIASFRDTAGLDLTTLMNDGDIIV